MVNLPESTVEYYPYMLRWTLSNTSALHAALESREER